MSHTRPIQRILAAILSSVTLLSCTSCGFILLNDVSGQQSKETDPAAEADAPDDPEESFAEYTRYTEPTDYKALSEKYLAELPKRNYEGAVFFITTPTRDYLAPEDTATPVARLAIERNAKVEDLLGITMIPSVAAEDTMLTELKQDVAADTYYTDLLMIPIYKIGSFRAENTLLNMRSAPFFDINQPYFNAESSDMTSGGYATYGVAGDASIAPSSYSAVYMNKAILTEAGVDVNELYSSAIDGSWTWDAMFRAVDAVRALNADGTSYYTVTAQNTASRLPDLIFKSAGLNFIRAGQRKTPTIGYTINSVKPVLSYLSDVYGDSMSITDGDADAVNCFSKGESAFLVDYLYVMPWLTNARADWGLLPLPKGKESDSYRTLIANTETVFSIPINHTNTEYAALTLSALNAASSGYLYESYVEEQMMNVLRDNASVNMLDLLLDTASFDFALAFGNAYPEIAAATYQLIRDTAAESAMREETELQEDFRETFTALAKTALECMKKNFDLRY